MNELSNSCIPSEGGHLYKEFSGSSYFKQTGQQGAFGPIHDQSVAYQKLFCQKCGHTIEVVARDKRKEAP